MPIVSRTTPTLTVIITGAKSGYLASFIASEAATNARWSHLRIIGTTRTNTVPSHGDATPSLVTLRHETPEEISVAAETLRKILPDVIVHAAAMSSPAQCERDEREAHASNCPTGLIEAIEMAEGADRRGSIRIIYLSTDQVYPGDRTVCRAGGKGSRSTHADVDPSRLPIPINAYGRSKLAFENLLAERRGRTCYDDVKINGLCTVILRASNMIGPRSSTTGQGKFIQWLDSALSASLAKTFEEDKQSSSVRLFVDEIRSFVYVRDVARFVLAAAVAEKLPDDGKSEVAVYNLGGLEALSRADLGHRVCEVRGILKDVASQIISLEKRADVVGGAYPSPLDIGMDSSKILQDFGNTMKITTLEDALKESLDNS